MSIRIFKVAAFGLSLEVEYWALSKMFDLLSDSTLLYEPQKGSGQGIGVFGRLGVSDGNPNPMHFFFSVGGGKGIIPGRSFDRYGIGYYYPN